MMALPLKLKNKSHEYDLGHVEPALHSAWDSLSLPKRTEIFCHVLRYYWIMNNDIIWDVDNAFTAL